jgi:hypothetical protein
LHWESLDLDLSVPGLLSSVFAAPEWLAETAASAASGRRLPRPPQPTETGAKVGARTLEREWVLRDEVQADLTGTILGQCARDIA